MDPRVFKIELNKQYDQGAKDAIYLIKRSIMQEAKIEDKDSWKFSNDLVRVLKDIETIEKVIPALRKQIRDD